MSPHQQLYEQSVWLWPLLLNHLWQTTLIVVSAWLAVALLKGAPARTRHVLRLIAFSKFLLPSALLLVALQRSEAALARWLPDTALPAASLTIIFDAAQPFSELAAPFQFTATTAGEAASSQHEIYCVLTGVWLCGTLTLLLLWRRRRRRFAQTLRAGRYITRGREFEALQRAQARLSQAGRAVSLLLSPQAVAPGVWRIWRPVIVLPAGLAEKLNDDELDAVLLHELLHIRYWDNLRDTLQMLVCCVFWFHPLVWLLDRQLRDERELLCDERVLRLGNTAETYAASLWKVAQFGLGWPVAGVARATGSNLKRRIEFMLSVNHNSQPSLTRRLLALAAIPLLLAAAVALALFSHEGARAAMMQI